MSRRTLFRHQAISFSFVDLFACGLGAALLLFMLTLLAPNDACPIPGEVTTIRFRWAINNSHPRLSAAAAIGGRLVFPKDRAPPVGPYLRIHNTISEVIVLLSGNCQPQDQLFVYLEDRDRASGDSWPVAVSLTGPRTEKGRLEFSPIALCYTIRLSTLSDPRPEVKMQWNAE